MALPSLSSTDPFDLTGASDLPGRPDPLATLEPSASAVHQVPAPAATTHGPPDDVDPGMRSGVALRDLPDRERETQSLFEELERTDDEERRQRLLDRVVTLNLPMARGIALRYRDRGENIDDLVQVASMGLVKAARGFDRSRGTTFTAFANPTIAGEVKRHFRDRGWDIRPPRRLQDLRMRLDSTVESFVQENSRTPTISELARLLEVGQEEVLETLAAVQSYSVNSLDAQVDAEGSTPLRDTLGGDDKALQGVVDHLALKDSLRSLSDRDRTILSRRFFDGWTQTQIAQEIGVTQMQVSRLLSRILGQLRTELEVG